VYKCAEESVKKQVSEIKSLLGDNNQQRSPDQSDDRSALDADNPFPEPIEIEITDVFDLHTIRPREVKLVVEEYLHQAREKGFRNVRIIHGKGIGVQREMVRSILAKTPFVVDWTDAPPEAGGLGATIVRINTQS
jgi:dsDNA-specific endonuclease/ATPase MutS2